MSPRKNKAESLLSCILDNASVSMLCVGPALRVVLAGSNWRARLGEGEDEDGRQIHRVFAESEQRDEVQELLRKVFRTGKPLVGQRLEDRNRHYEYSIIPFMWGGEVTYAILVLRDTTEELRLLEEVRAVQSRLTSIVESASDIVISLDLSGRIVTWNNAARAITGRSSREVTGRRLADLCPGDSREAFSHAIAETLRTKRVGPVRLRLCGRDAEVRTVDWAFSAMADEAGTVSGIVAVGRDLTEQLETEGRLQRADRLAALGVMAGGIAHEVRNPLAISSAAAQLLLTRPLDRATQLECAEKIHTGIERASHIIESLLRFARSSEPGQQSVLDMTNVIREALRLVENQRKLVRVKLSLSLGRRRSTVRGNPTLLMQAVVNLLLNAVNAMPDGGGLFVSSAREADKVLVRVRDTGRGIPKDDVRKVFDPFFTTMRVGMGTGLGLSVTYAIVQQHGGDLQIESAEGQGTVVTVELPLAGEKSP